CQRSVLATANLGGAHENQQGRLSLTLGIQDHPAPALIMAAGQLPQQSGKRARLGNFESLGGDARGLFELGEIADGDFHRRPSQILPSSFAWMAVSMTDGGRPSRCVPLSRPATGASRTPPLSTSRSLSAIRLASVGLCVT